MNLPESPIFINKYMRKIENFLYKPMQNKVLVIFIGEIKIYSAWLQISDFDTVDYDGRTYDYQNVYTWFGFNVLFVRKNCRIPINFKDYLSCFNDDGSKHHSLSLNPVTAHEKMNNRNISEFVRANRDSDLIKYSSLVAAGASIIGVAVLMDYVHSPILSQILEVVRSLQ